MLAELDPLTWDLSIRNAVMGFLVIGHVLCVLVAVFLLDALLPNTSTPGMSKRKALEYLVLFAFLVLATAIAAFALYVGGRLLYGHWLSLPGAPMRSRRAISMLIGHGVMGFVVFRVAWALLRQRRLIQKV